NRFFQLAHIVERDLPRLGQLRHHGLRAPAEETQNLVEHALPRHIPRDDRREHIRIANPLNAADGLLRLHSVNDRLNCRVRRSRLGKRSMNVTDRGLAKSPEGFENPEFQLAESGLWHLPTTL